jgi:hypothetical protein
MVPEQKSGAPKQDNSVADSNARLYRYENDNCDEKCEMEEALEWVKDALSENPGSFTHILLSKDAIKADPMHGTFRISGQDVTLEWKTDPDRELNKAFACKTRIWSDLVIFEHGKRIFCDADTKFNLIRVLGVATTGNCQNAQ